MDRVVYVAGVNGSQYLYLYIFATKTPTQMNITF